MTKAKKPTKRRKGQSASKAMLDAVPSNWCDPLLTGPRAVIGSPPYDCQDIERLLNAVREQVRQASNDGIKRAALAATLECSVRALVTMEKEYDR